VPCGPAAPASSPRSSSKIEAAGYTWFARTRAVRACGAGVVAKIVE
jgi:hypothetical protein